MTAETKLIVIVTMWVCFFAYITPRWRHWLLTLLMKLIDHERPSFVIGGTDRPYIKRWWFLPRNRFFNIYLHHVLRSDDDRALHDHPWLNCSIVLAGGYFEVTPKGRFWRKPGSICFRRATARHRLELPLDTEAEEAFNLDGNPPERAAWSLFIIGPKIRDWGFWCPQGFVPWRDFVASHDTGRVGPGCDQPEIERGA